ncbi:stealth family protein [Ancylomarina longa]|uniref:Capsular biosynthesis protein n=1 Tax=Ancylomarina longa TaxID=2487017 RepID=A0A434AWT5_9BACT|nr:stealth family protein [Ancylomarina longa]RUT78867.1 capsular biosynthesis protein [Ancylomarina longa]
MSEIDIVLLWVDGNDPEWQKEYRKQKKSLTESDTLATGASRYQDWNNLQYIFRGIEKFMPWVRKIHFITWGHLPKWLKVDYPKLAIHNHQDIFQNPNHLPTFNSNAIEFNIVGIPDLSEKFILFNDDSFILQTTSANRFFQNDLPVDFLALGFPHRGYLYNRLRKHTVFMDTMVNNISALNSHFKKKDLLKANKAFFYHESYPFAFRFKNFLVNLISNQYEVMVINHHPQPHLKSTILKVKEKCKAQFEITSASKFRDRNNITQYLFRFWNLASGKFVPNYQKDHVHLNITSLKSLTKDLEKIKSTRFLCANDNLDSATDFEACKELLNPLLDGILPEKSSFEI